VERRYAYGSISAYKYSNPFLFITTIKYCFSLQQEFMKQNTPRQKKNCLQNFDLSEHRQILSDLAIHIYHRFITVMEKTLTPMIGLSPLPHTVALLRSVLVLPADQSMPQAC